MDCAYLVLKGEEELGIEGEKEVQQGRLTAEEYLNEQQDEFLREVFSYAVSDEFEEDEENNLADVQARHGDEHINQLDGALDDSSDALSDVSDSGSDVSWDPVAEARKRRGSWLQRNDSESSSDYEESPIKVPRKKLRPMLEGGEGSGIEQEDEGEGGGEEQEDGGEGGGDGQAEVQITPPPSEDEGGVEVNQQKDGSQADEGDDRAETINLEEVVTVHVEDEVKEPEEHVQRPLKANASKAIDPKWRTFDKKGREILKIPMNGSFYQFLASNESNPSTIASHMEHLSIVRLLENRKTGEVRIEFHIVDQGAGTVCWKFYKTMLFSVPR